MAISWLQAQTLLLFAFISIETTLTRTREKSSRMTIWYFDVCLLSLYIWRVSRNSSWKFRFCERKEIWRLLHHFRSVRKSFIFGKMCNFWCSLKLNEYQVKILEPHLAMANAMALIHCVSKVQNIHSWFSNRLNCLQFFKFYAFVRLCVTSYAYFYRFDSSFVKCYVCLGVEPQFISHVHCAFQQNQNENIFKEREKTHQYLRFHLVSQL